MRMSRIGLLVVAAAVVALAAPSSASAWHVTLLDFFQFAPPSATGDAHITAKKCHGGKLGTYKFRAYSAGEGGETALAVEVSAKLPVTEKWKPLRDVEVLVHSSENIDPMIPIAITESLADFFSGSEARWRPHRKHNLLFDHPALTFTFFGQTVEVVPAERVSLKFKPKPGC